MRWLDLWTHSGQ